MCVKGFRNGDGKIAGRIARDFMLQIDDNVLDHRNAPLEGVRPSRRALSRSVLSWALMPVKVQGRSLSDAVYRAHLTPVGRQRKSPASPDAGAGSWVNSVG